MTSNRWVVLGLLSFDRISMGLHLQSLGALAPSLAPELST
jgi:hypothetical protein